MLIEIRHIPVVREPSPSAARYLVSMRPTIAALMTEYMGWKNIPKIGQRENLEISLTVLHVDNVGGHFVSSFSSIGVSTPYFSLLDINNYKSNQFLS